MVAVGFCSYWWSKEGQVCGLRAKVHVCRCGAFSVPRFDLVFFLYQNPSCSIQTRKRACFAFLFVRVNSTHEKRPVGNRRSDGIRSKTNRTTIVWSRLVKASVSNGERGFARSVPGQGSWRAFWLGIAVKRKHCKDFGVWVYHSQHCREYVWSDGNCARTFFALDCLCLQWSQIF